MVLLVCFRYMYKWENKGKELTKEQICEIVDTPHDTKRKIIDRST